MHDDHTSAVLKILGWQSIMKEINQLLEGQLKHRRSRIHHLLHHGKSLLS